MQNETATGKASGFNRAQETARKFLECWRTVNGVGVYRHIQKTWAAKFSETQVQKAMQSRFEIERLKEYRVRSATKQNAMCDIRAEIVLKEDERKMIYFRMVCETAPYKPDATGQADWGINPSSIRVENM